jgi:hypothetical protein
MGNMAVSLTTTSVTTGLSWDNLLHIVSPYLVAAALGYIVAQLLKTLILLI